LAAALERLPQKKNDPRVLVGFNHADDAGVVKINDELALVQTVDLFTPIVDDPFTYGQISAANSLSDIYAMGGKPISALNIVGFPKDIFSLDILGDILAGGQTKAEEADCAIVGGHTIKDDELKYGMAVTGLIHPKKIISNAGAQPGDVLLLSKPIGTGTITTALKAGKGNDAMVKRAVEVMLQLNRDAADISIEIGIHACTDITGFGLLGHALEMAEASGVGLELDFARIPILADAIETTAQGFVPGGTKSNHLYVAPNVTYTSSLTMNQQLLLNDPQTSGGLLLAVPQEKVQELQKRLTDRGVDASVIGIVNDKKEKIQVK